jgi:hypothetical protein
MSEFSLSALKNALLKTKTPTETGNFRHKGLPSPADGG